MLLVTATLVALVVVPVTLPSTFATSVPVVTVKLPVLAPVKDPVPNKNLSSDSSHPIKALSELPLSITSPASLEGEPLVPLASSIKASLMVELVVSIVVVVPFTSKLPAITTLPSNVPVLVTSNVPAISILSANSLDPTALAAILSAFIELLASLSTLIAASAILAVVTLPSVILTVMIASVAS